jgi:Xaa-Pro dipeptidase
VNEDGFWGAIDACTGTSLLFMPRLPAAYAVWFGVIQGPEHYKAKYGVDQVAYVDEMAQVLKDLNPPVLHLLAGTNTDRWGAGSRVKDGGEVLQGKKVG